MSRGVVVTQSKFVPREYCLNPRRFGREARLEWVGYLPAQAGDSQVAEELRREAMTFYSQLRAAQAQHYFAYRIRERMDDLDMGVPEYAQQSGQDQTRVYRVLKGEVLMRLEDVALAHHVLGGVWEVLDDEGNGHA